MIFNGIEKDYITVMRDRSRPFFATDDNREITVPVFIEYDSISQYQKVKEEVAGWLVHDEPKPLIFTDDDDRVYFATVTDISEGDTHQRGAEATITFNCGSKYSLERSIDITSTAQRVINGHKATHWQAEVVFGQDETSYELQFAGKGKTELRDICNIKLNFGFRKNDVLVIDYKKRKVTVNGKDITNSLVILESNFMKLPIGNVTFTASHKTKVLYHERYY